MLTAHTNFTSLFKHREPPLPPRDRLQVPGPPRGPCRALVRPGAIQAAPNTQPWVLCVSLTALVISPHAVVVGGWGGFFRDYCFEESDRATRMRVTLHLCQFLKGYTSVVWPISFKSQNLSKPMLECSFSLISINYSNPLVEPFSFCLADQVII